jgi:HrpA-like RNA helicase
MGIVRGVLGSINKQQQVDPWLKATASTSCSHAGWSSAVNNRARRRQTVASALGIAAMSIDVEEAHRMRQQQEDYQHNSPAAQAMLDCRRQLPAFAMRAEVLASLQRNQVQVTLVIAL